MESLSYRRDDLGVFALAKGFALRIGFAFGDCDNTARKVRQTLEGSSVRRIRL